MSVYFILCIFAAVTGAPPPVSDGARVVTEEDIIRANETSSDPIAREKGVYLRESNRMVGASREELTAFYERWLERFRRDIATYPQNPAVRRAKSETVALLNGLGRHQGSAAALEDMLSDEESPQERERILCEMGTVLKYAAVMGKDIDLANKALVVYDQIHELQKDHPQPPSYGELNVKAQLYGDVFEQHGKAVEFHIESWKWVRKTASEGRKDIPSFGPETEESLLQNAAKQFAMGNQEARSVAALKELEKCPDAQSP